MSAIPPSPRSIRSAHVDPFWVDIYGHMNMAYYVKLFDDLGHDILGEFGLGEAYTRRFGFGLFTVKATITYVREVMANAPLTVSLTIDNPSIVVGTARHEVRTRVCTCRLSAKGLQAAPGVNQARG